MSLMELFVKWVVQWMFGVQNWAIRSVRMTYEVFGEVTGPASTFWRTLDLTPGTVKTVDVHKHKWQPVPSFIKIKALAVNYLYEGKTFTHVQATTNFVWPPKKTSTFCLPIKHALIYDEHDVCVMDVTDAVKKLAGPKGDTSIFKRFHKLVVTDVLDHSSTFVAK